MVALAWANNCWATPWAAAVPTAPKRGLPSSVTLSVTASASLRSSSAALVGGGPYSARRRAFSAARSSSQAVAQASGSGAAAGPGACAEYSADTAGEPDGALESGRSASSLMAGSYGRG